MTKEEFNERWNKFFTIEKLKTLLFRSFHKSGKTRWEIFKEQNLKSLHKRKPLKNKKPLTKQEIARKNYLKHREAKK